MVAQSRLERYLAYIAQDEDASGLPDFPVSHVEMFLARIAGQSVETPPPDSRIEMFLAKLAGDNVETPVPMTRVELILAAIIRGSIVFPTPLTRMEYFLKEWAYGTSDLKTQPVVGYGRVDYAVI